MTADSDTLKQMGSEEDWIGRDVRESSPNLSGIVRAILIIIVGFFGTWALVLSPFENPYVFLLFMTFITGMATICAYCNKVFVNDFRNRR